MIKLDNDKAIFCDCDDTLIMYEVPPDKYSETIILENNGYSQQVLPHWEHVKLLKKFKLLGYKVVLWSRTGSEWAAKIAELLDITNDVDYIMSKPMYFVDDKTDLFSVVGEHIYKDIKGNK